MQLTSGGRSGGRVRKTPFQPKPVYVTRDTNKSYGGRVFSNQNNPTYSGSNWNLPPGGPFSGNGFVNPMSQPNPRKKVTALFARKPSKTNSNQPEFTAGGGSDNGCDGNGGSSAKQYSKRKKQQKLRSGMPMRFRKKTKFESGNGSVDSINNTWQSDTPSSNYNSASWYSVNKPSNATIELNSNIHSGLIYNKAQDNRAGDWTNLLISCGEMFPPEIVSSDPDGTANTYLGSVVLNDIYYEHLRVCQIQINRIITDKFRKPQWYGYLFAVCKGLQIYYMYDAIQAYISDPNNQNPAMVRLYNSISSEAWNHFSELKLELSKHYIKPEMRKFIMFMYQNFTYHKGEAGCIMRLSWRDALNSFTLDENGFEMGSYIIDAINDLRQPDTLTIAAYLSRGFPNWQIKSLDASTSKPIYSEDFINFWLNQNSAYSALNGADPTKTVVSYGKIVTSKDQNSPYYLVGDDVDGLILSCNGLSLAKGLAFKQYCGMWTPWDNFTSITDARYECSILLWDGYNRVPLDLLEDATQIGVMHFAVFTTGGESQPDHFTGFRQYYPFTKPVLTTSINSMAQVCNDAYRYLLYPNSAT
jgi:hypothetical protein